MSTLEINPDRCYERRGSASDRDISYNHDTLSVYSSYSNYSGHSSDRPSVVSVVSPRESRLTNRSSRSIKVVPMVLPKSTQDDFELVELIGQGALGKVYKCIKKDNGQMYALKLYRKADVVACAQSRSIKNEKAILSHLDHPNIVSLHFSFKTADDLCMIVDFAGPGDLLRLIDRVNTLSNSDAKFYAANIVLALDYLHTKKILHRDLKSANLMINSDGYLKLIDFGNAKVSSGKTTTICGTAFYMAPEMANGKKYGRSADWWSVGIILYEMLHGLDAFEIKDRGSANKIYETVEQDLMRFSDALDSQTRNLIKGLLRIDSKNRIGYKPGTKKYIVTQPYFSSIDFDAIYNKKMTPPRIPSLTEATPLKRNSARRKSMDLYIEDQIEALPRKGSNFDYTFNDY